MESRERSVITWEALSTNDPYIFEIKIEDGITIILVDTCTECVIIVHDPMCNDLLVKRFCDIPHLLCYLEKCCSDSEKYVLKIYGKHDVYVHRRDLIDALVRCMTVMPHYARPYYSKDESN